MSNITNENQDRLKQYKADELKRMIINGVYLIGTLACAFLLFVIVSGGRFAWLMGGIGISFHNQEAGVYADCSKREDRNSPYCRPKASQSEVDWKGIAHTKGAPVPFSLSDR